MIIILLATGGLIWYNTPKQQGEAGERGFLFGPPQLGNNRELTNEAAESEVEQPKQENNLPSKEATQSNTSRLAEEVVAGATSVSGNIRYIERATGHVWEIDPRGENKTRISNTTIPGIFEVIWSPTGERAVLKYFSEGKLSILSALFKGSSTQGTFLSSDVTDVVFSPNGDRIGYVITQEGETKIISATPENKLPRVRFRSPFSSWKISWPEEENMYLLTRPSAFIEGFFYRLNFSSGALLKITGPASGLEAKTNGAFVIVSQFDPSRKAIRSVVEDLKTRETKLLSSSILAILPEKCTWSRKARNIIFCAASSFSPRVSYPDDWYKGKVTFSNKLLKIDIKTLSVTNYELPQGSDVAEPFLTKDESALFFINKRDGSLWGVNLGP